MAQLYPIGKTGFDLHCLVQTYFEPFNNDFSGIYVPLNIASSESWPWKTEQLIFAAVFLKPKSVDSLLEMNKRMTEEQVIFNLGFA